MGIPPPPPPTGPWFYQRFYQGNLNCYVPQPKLVEEQPTEPTAITPWFFGEKSKRSLSASHYIKQLNSSIPGFEEKIHALVQTNTKTKRSAVPPKNPQSKYFKSRSRLSELGITSQRILAFYKLNLPSAQLEWTLDCSSVDEVKELSSFIVDYNYYKTVTDFFQDKTYRMQFPKCLNLEEKEISLWFINEHETIEVFHKVVDDHSLFFAAPYSENEIESPLFDLKLSIERITYTAKEKFTMYRNFHPKKRLAPTEDVPKKRSKEEHKQESLKTEQKALAQDLYTPSSSETIEEIFPSLPKEEDLWEDLERMLPEV